MALRDFVERFLLDRLLDVAAALSAAALLLYNLFNLFPVTYDLTLYPPFTLSTGIFSPQPKLVITKYRTTNPTIFSVSLIYFTFLIFLTLCVIV